MTMTKMFRMTIDIPVEEHKRLKLISAARGVTMREMILDSLREKTSPLSENALETLRAIESAKNPENLIAFKDAEDLFKQLGI